MMFQKYTFNVFAKKFFFIVNPFSPMPHFLAKAEIKTILISVFFILLTDY